MTNYPKSWQIREINPNKKCMQLRPINLNHEQTITMGSYFKVKYYRGCEFKNALI
jgi:hypothetical protein